MQQCGQLLINTSIQVCCSAKPCSTSCISESYSSSNTTKGRCEAEFFYNIHNNPSSGVPALIFSFMGPILVAYFLPFLFCRRPFNYLIIIKCILLNAMLILVSYLFGSIHQSMRIIFSEIVAIFVTIYTSMRDFKLSDFGQENGFIEVHHPC